MTHTTFPGSLRNTVFHYKIPGFFRFTSRASAVDNIGFIKFFTWKNLSGDVQLTYEIAYL